jgi:hypothetical protein
MELSAEEKVDRRTDPDYVERCIRHISDEELIGAMDLTRLGLRGDGDFFQVWGNYWNTVLDRGRYLGDGDLLMPAPEAAASLEHRRAEILAAADQLLQHNINGWGDVTIQHGPIVDFNAAYGRSGKYGFHYWLWARALTRAFLLTGDQKYVAEFDALFNTWYEQRDAVTGEIPELHPIYYELGLGVRNRVFFEYYCLPYEARTARTHERMLKTLLGAARWLYQEEKRMYRGGNWQIMGSFGLVQIGLMVPEFKEASQWVPLGVDRLQKHAEKDFYADGCHSERVPSSYSLVAYRDSRNLVHLLNNSKEYAHQGEPMRAMLGRMENWFAAILPPDGYLPGINDGSRQKMPAGIVREACEKSVHLPSSGFTAFRAGDKYLLINHGPSGGGHSHADSLSFEMHAFGQAMAIDSGIGLSYDDPNHQPWYTQSKAHNMLVVDDSSLDRRQAEGRDVVVSTGEHLDYFAATHYGYAASKGVTHRRHFAFIRPDYFVIFDAIASRADGTAREMTWNLHSPLEFVPRTSGFASVGAPGLIVLPASKDWVPRRDKGIASVAGIPGYTTTHAKIDWLAFQGSLAPGGRTEFAVLLLPFANRRPEVRMRTLSQSESGSHFAIDHATGTDHLLFANPGMKLESNGMVFSGACALVRRRSDRPSIWAVSHGLQLAVDGKSVVESRTLFSGEGEMVL